MRLLLSAALLAASTAAQAHAILMESSPAPNAVLPAGPTRLVLRFNSRIDHQRSLLVLRGGPKPLTLPIEPGSAADALASRTDLAAGNYTLRWQVLAVDGHITRGDVPFTVQK